MEVSQPVPLQPSWHTQYQPLLPSVHLPFPLHKPGQPSVCDKIGGEKKEKGQRRILNRVGLLGNTEKKQKTFQTSIAGKTGNNRTTI